MDHCDYKLYTINILKGNLVMEFKLDKLMESVQLTEKIAASVIDDQSYNVVTKKSNSSLMESISDVEDVLKHEKFVNDDPDFAQLESEINSALGIVEAKAEPKKVAPVAKPVVKPVAKPVVAAKPVAKPVVKEVPKKKTVTEGDATPAKGVNSADTFQGATPVKQEAFVYAKIEQKASKSEVDKEAEKALEEKRKEAEKVQKDNLKETQNKVDVLKPESPVPAAKLESATKFKSFISDIKGCSEDTAVLEAVEAIEKAFDVIYKTK
jgi:hypothetical protein